MTLYNFSAGPAMLPKDVLNKLKDTIVVDNGISCLEMGHRTDEFAAIMFEIKALFRTLLGIPKNYDVLLLQGGASLQFAMIPLNLMESEAHYILTDRWSVMAFDEAKLTGNPKVAFSSENKNFCCVPSHDQIEVSDTTSYLHITSNNSIYGTQFDKYPVFKNIPLIADMTSDILSKQIDVSQFGLIYASAQKNLGTAGVTLVIIRDDLIKRSYRKIPNYLCYSTHAQASSIYNTPPVFAIYVMKLVLEWVKSQGGINEVEKVNRLKAKLLYDAIDSSNVFKGRANKDNRSITTVCFTLPTKEMTEKFLSEAKNEGLVGLAGHRLAGGIRAAIFNAMPVEGVERLAEFMKDFDVANV